MDKDTEILTSTDCDVTSSVQDVDLQNMSIDDMLRVRNPVLREILLAAKEQLQQELSSSYVSHNQHGNHTNSAG
jgi:hypothetical protein